ncbi:MAG: LPS export ABC transporter periplasmic protein LptC [Chromatiales bacterium]
MTVLSFRKLKHWPGVIALSVCAGTTAWILERLEEQNIPREAVGPDEPDSYMENFVRTAMDERGRLESRLRAKRMFHYPRDDTTQLLQPTFELYSDNRKAPWFARADSGWIGAGNDAVLLYGNVSVWRQNPKGLREIEVQAPDLRILPEKRYAETDSATTIITPTSVTNGIGMRARLALGLVELLKNVRTHYAEKR